MYLTKIWNIKCLLCSSSCFLHSSQYTNLGWTHEGSLVIESFVFSNSKEDQVRISAPNSRQTNLFTLNRTSCIYGSALFECQKLLRHVLTLDYYLTSG